LRRRLTQLEVDTLALEAMALRTIGENQASLVKGLEASVLKVRGTELRQDLFDLLFDISGDSMGDHMDNPRGDDMDDLGSEFGLSRYALNMLDARKLTLYGGTSEVQRNMIARALLAA
jgi:alkylation response protein AidB-like acyl-CoA dehydrogenase